MLSGKWKLLRQLIPDLLSLSRIFLLPLLFVLHFAGELLLFTILLLFSGLTDILDGCLARRWNTVSARGSRLDSLADLPLFLALLYFAGDRCPELLHQWLPAVSVVTVLRIGLLSVSLLRTGKPVMLHTVLNKATGLLFFLLVLTAPAGTGPVAVPALLLTALAATVEEILIWFRFGAVEPDTRSYAAAVKKCTNLPHAKQTREG